MICKTKTNSLTYPPPPPGIQYAPKKIQNLNEINKILAHQPWLLTKEHIEVSF